MLLLVKAEVEAEERTAKDCERANEERVHGMVEDSIMK
jgi:hypothetical protein